MKYEEKKHMERNDISKLLTGMGELIESGQIELGHQKINMPDTALVEVEYKEKKGWAELEVEIKWRVGGDEKRMDKKVGSQGRKDIKSVKKSLKGGFNNIRKSVEKGALPSAEMIDEFIHLSKDFELLSKGMSFEGGTRSYMDLVLDLNQASNVGDLERIRQLVGDLRAAKKGCHRTYRWKE